MIDKNAIVDSRSEISSDVDIGPFSIIGANVKIDSGTKIGTNVIIDGWTTIGKDCRIFSNANIGGEPQDFAYKGERSFCEIGDRNIIREFVTIHRGTKIESKTVIGNDNYFMIGSHIGHNCKIGNKVVLVNFVSLGGYVEIDDGAFISAVCQVHQFVRIGKLAMIGALSKVTKDVPPYMLTAEHTAQVYGINVVGLRRAGFSQDLRNKIKEAYKIVYHSGYNISQALEVLEKDAQLPEIKYFIDFIKSSNRGICAHYRKKSE